MRFHIIMLIILAYNISLFQVHAFIIDENICRVNKNWVIEEQEDKKNLVLFKDIIDNKITYDSFEWIKNKNIIERKGKKNRNEFFDIKANKWERKKIKKVIQLYKRYHWNLVYQYNQNFSSDVLTKITINSKYLNRLYDYKDKLDSDFKEYQRDLRT